MLGRSALLAACAVASSEGSAFESVVGGATNCNVASSDKKDCGHEGTTQSMCEASGCCWQPVDVVTGAETTGGDPWCFHPSDSPTPPSPTPGGTCDVDASSRQDCGHAGTTQSMCEASGCCWQPSEFETSGGTPWCFYKNSGPTPPTPPGPPRRRRSPSPPGPDPSHPVNSRDAFVHLFEWSWSDVAQECEQFLGPKGFTGVQISPPNDHMKGDPWWVRYQPVTYELISRSGNAEQFADMIRRCKAVGVGIYADGVINHIAAGSGTSVAGHSYANRATPIYSQQDMHHNQGDMSKNCVIDNYANKWNVQYCDLSGLPDLCTGCDYVQKTVSDYINHMGEVGIAGFRIDAAKHMDSGELHSLLNRVNSNLWKFGEVIEGAGEAVTPGMYTGYMDVTEFDFAQKLAPNFKDDGKLQFLSTFGESWGLFSSGRAVVFIDNHDTQRGNAPLTYKNGAIYNLINVFMLAHPYGYPKVMSSYYFTGHDQGPPGSPVHSGGNVNCGDGHPWVCEHRWTSIANMVNWRRTAGTAGISHWSSGGGDQIGFCRGSNACVALNRGGSTWHVAMEWPLPNGVYCNVAASDDTTKCPTFEVRSGQVYIAVPSMQAVALHTGKMHVSSINVSKAVIV